MRERTAVAARIRRIREEQHLNQQFIEGEAVFDADGDKVGAVQEYNAQDGYLVVQKGWLFPKDLYIPVGAIQRNDAEGVYLSLHKDDLARHAYDEAPTDVAGRTRRPTASDNAMADTRANSVAMAPAETIVETGDDVRVPVFEEELLVRKRDEEVGRVRIHKEILTEQQTVSAPVTHEEVYVQRVPAQGRYTGVATDAFTESDVVITVMGEELIVGKHAMVTEEVRVHKDMTTEQQDITDTVRHERVYVEGVEESQRTNSNQR